MISYPEYSRVGFKRFKRKLASNILAVPPPLENIVEMPINKLHGAQ
jgi:hypothetical protein